MSAAELELLVGLGLVEATARTADGRVTEYRLTGAGRILAGRVQPTEGSRNARHADTSKR